MIRVLHFSDVHVDVPIGAMPLRELIVPKRILGGANLLLRRKRRFRAARAKLAELARFAERTAIDLTVCSGDLTALGTEAELVAAREAIEPLTRPPLGFVITPGNHDLYVPDTVADGRFERVFGDFLGSDAPELAVDGPFPIVRFAGDALAVIVINSARPNPQLLRSSGRIPDVQLTGLQRALSDERLRGRRVLVVTHYAPRRADGTPDKPSHGLDNADALLSICERAPGCVVMHGHIHHRLHVRTPGGLHLLGAGSTTQRGIEGIWVLELEGEGARALPGCWDGQTYVLDHEAAVTL